MILAAVLGGGRPVTSPQSKSTKSVGVWPRWPSCRKTPGKLGGQGQGLQFCRFGVWSWCCEAWRFGFTLLPDDFGFFGSFCFLALKSIAQATRLNNCKLRLARLKLPFDPCVVRGGPVKLSPGQVVTSSRSKASAMKILLIGDSFFPSGCVFVFLTLPPFGGKLKEQPQFWGSNLKKHTHLQIGVCPDTHALDNRCHFTQPFAQTHGTALTSATNDSIIQLQHIYVGLLLADFICLTSTPQQHHMTLFYHG